MCLVTCRCAHDQCSYFTCRTADMNGDTDLERSWSPHWEVQSVSFRALVNESFAWRMPMCTIWLLEFIWPQTGLSPIPDDDCWTRWGNCFWFSFSKVTMPSLVAHLELSCSDIDFKLCVAHIQSPIFLTMELESMKESRFKYSLLTGRLGSDQNKSSKIEIEIK